MFKNRQTDRQTVVKTLHLLICGRGNYRKSVSSVLLKM